MSTGATLAQAVQRNCHVADAHHATELTLCIYLLQMREFYRWEQGLPLGAALCHRDVGEWLDQRELLWDGLADASYVELVIDAERFDPFDAGSINERLLPQRLVYGAGRLASGRPVFLLAELERSERRDGLQVLVAGRELARGLAAPPAALSGRTALVRRDALRRWLWEKFEAWGLRHVGPFGDALVACGHDGGDPSPALERMVDEQLETLLLHELGEHRAGELLGADWVELRLATGGDRRIEPRLRAVRDHLADCLVTLPVLLERAATASIHFWFANLDGLRLEMFPSAAAAYPAWRDGDGGRALGAALELGCRHWRALAHEAVTLHRRLGDEGRGALATLLEQPSVRC